jgi:predicted nucleic acid-binding protein
MARRTMMRTSTVRSRSKVFVDTGGWYAVASANDRYHAVGTGYFRELLDAGARLLTSDYVLDETLTRLRYDAGHSLAREFWQRLAQAQQAGFLTILRVDEPAWNTALDIFFQYQDQAFSFTDCTSFVLAQAHPVDEVFTFDAHFLMFGLVIKPRPDS